jgi:hypothetical protein
MKKRKFIFFANGLLILMVAFFFFLNYYKRELIIDGSYQARPGELIKIIGEHTSDSQKNGLSLIFVFNDLPSKSNVESIEKLDHKFTGQINIIALFTKQFSFEKKSFPYIFLSRLKIVCKRKNSMFRKRFYLIMKKNRVVYSDSDFDFANLAFIVQKNISPHLTYEDYAISSEELKEKIKKKFKKGDFNLLQLNTNQLVNVGTITRNVSKIHFFHASCSTCQLKSIMVNLRINRVLDEEKQVLVFSVFADSFALRKILRPDNNLDIYLDTHDELDLMSVFVDEKVNPLIIDANEINRGL